MVTTARDWKSKTPTGEVVLKLPSGNECLARAIRPEAFLSADGLIPDSLTAMVTKAVNSKRGLPPAKLDEIAKDPVKLAAAMEMFDRVLVYAVVEPAVELPPVCVHGDDAGNGCGHLYTGGEGVHIKRNHPQYHKIEESPRDPDVLYADMVDMEDKQFIFQWAIGGTSDVNKFRKQLQSHVGAVPQG